MSKVLFMNMPAHGHINPTLGLVEELIGRGEEVTYLTGEEFREKIEKTGAKFKSFRFYLDDKDEDTDTSASEVPYEVKEAVKMLERVVKTCQSVFEVVFSGEEKYDYVIYDSMFIIGAEIGKALNVPTICSHTTLVNAFEAPSNPEGLECFMGEFEHVLNSIKEMEETYGIRFPDVISGYPVAEGMLNLVYTSRYFHPVVKGIDDSYKFIGISVADRKEKMAFPFEKIADKKVIYISLGTIFNDSIEFYESCFEAFKDMDVKVVMSIGNRIDIGAFKSIPDNFIVLPYVPQLEVLKQTDIFITHGGPNSVNEALYNNVPMILVPQYADQFAVAYRVEELGAGINIEKDKVNANLLKEAVTRVLSDKSFKVNSEKIGDSLKDAGGVSIGADEILEFVSSCCEE
ncbi:macrolide family glycosyltransferase [Acetivibrio cellulolyticus]|uniref:macrolide family glycosyltransferase n=1 Tax=Acetivibrio cellulolyticus TaxID=35830 RepID=UPI0001E2FAE0|nr:macrolide family glycosyltransferase [Acetivibrio cellulolyticus]